MKKHSETQKMIIPKKFLDGIPLLDPTKPQSRFTISPTDARIKFEIERAE